jgi:hypothetical protein
VTTAVTELLWLVPCIHVRVNVLIHGINMEEKCFDRAGDRGWCRTYCHVTRQRRTETRSSPVPSENPNQSPQAYASAFPLGSYSLQVMHDLQPTEGLLGHSHKVLSSTRRLLRQGNPWNSRQMRGTDDSWCKKQ